MNNSQELPEEIISKRYKELSISWDKIVKERQRYLNQSSAEYQKLESDSIVKIVY